MASKLILSLMGALALSVAGSSLARAESTPSDDGAGSQTNDSQTKASKKGSKKKGSKKDSLDALERGNPHSVRYKSRKKSTHNPTNAEIDAAETGNPHSVDFKNREISNHKPTNEEIEAGEKGNPDAIEK